MWHREPRWRNRLLVEQEVMHARFPGFWLMRSASGHLVWWGLLEPAPGSRFLITVTMPTRYPYEEPELRVEEPPLRHDTPHRYASGKLCIHRSGGWDPTRGTVASLIPMAAGWLIAYLHWDQTGERF